MAHYLIWIPRAHVRGSTYAEQLGAVGLADHVPGAAMVHCEGPDGGPGQLYAWLGKGLHRHHFDGDLQSWSAAAADGDRTAGRFWVGTWNDDPPTEADVLRPGHDAWGVPVILGDGRTWLVPPVDLIPRSVALFPDGTTGLRVKPKFAALAGDRSRWVARLAGPPSMISLGDAARFVIEAMNLNYRLPLTAALHLGLFDEINTKAALMVALRPRAFYLGEGGDQ